MALPVASGSGSDHIATMWQGRPTDRGAPVLVVQVEADPRLEALRRLQPDMERVATFGQRNKLRGICVVSKQTLDPDSTTHCRFFAPHYGIPEDFVTGSVHSAMGVWLLEARQVPVIRDHAEFIAEQGDMLGRPGRLFVDVLVASRKPARVRVGGHAVTVLSGSLRLP